MLVLGLLKFLCHPQQGLLTLLQAFAMSFGLGLCDLGLLFLERSGASLETASEIVYWVNTTGLSLPYRRLLEEVVDGLGAMDLRAQGKPIRVGLKEMPP